jgi:hypothetical protein
MIEYISHEEFPDDNYTKELVYLQINGIRYGYVSKMTKQGNIFWDEISVGVTVNGEKKYFKAFKFDSEFLKDDIMQFLKAASWKKKAQAFAPPVQKFNTYAPPAPDQQQYQHVSVNKETFQDELPF